jgi:hypothetical protein
MADLTFTAGSVVLTGGVAETHTAGGTVARGNLVRRNTSLQIVVASDDSAINADAFGYALSDASSGQRVLVALLTGGGILGGVATGGGVGKPLCVSTNGATAPVDDIAGSEFVTLVGVQLSSSTIQLGKIAGGVAAAGAVS